MTISPLTALQRTDTAAPAERPRPAPTGAADTGFTAALDAAARGKPIPGKGPQAPKPGELQQFEAFVLRSFVESMLPKENSSFFGSGTAGGIWRSMMAERLGEEIAAAGGIGIADLLDRGAGSGEALRSAKAAEGAAAAADLRRR